MTPVPRITYTRHARDQMAERRISDAQVGRIITNPSRRYPSMNPSGRIIAERMTDQGNTLRVVYVERATEEGVGIRVITVIRIGRKRR